MFLWNSSNFCPLNLLLVRNHQAEIMIIQGRYEVTRLRVEPRSCDQGRQKKRNLCPLCHAADWDVSFIFRIFFKIIYLLSTGRIKGPVMLKKKKKTVA